MLQKNIVKNDSMCDMMRYVYIVKLQNFLNAPRMSMPLSCTVSEMLKLRPLTHTDTTTAHIPRLHSSCRRAVKVD